MHFTVSVKQPFIALVCSVFIVSTGTTYLSLLSFPLQCFNDAEEKMCSLSPRGDGVNIDLSECL